MDKIFEFLVKRENTVINTLCKCALWGFSFALAIILLFAIPQLGAIACVAIIYVTYKISLRFDVEFEYVYVNGDLDIDRIFSKNIRKKYLSIEKNRIVAIGSADDENIKKLSYNTKTIDVSSGTGEDVYAIIVNFADGRKKILIENCEIINNYKIIIPDKVF